MNACASYLNVGFLSSCIYILLLSLFYSLLIIHMIKVEVVHSDIYHDYIQIQVSLQKASTSLFYL
jgi:hypothetical protein